MTLYARPREEGTIAMVLQKSPPRSRGPEKRAHVMYLHPADGAEPTATLTVGTSMGFKAVIFALRQWSTGERAFSLLTPMESRELADTLLQFANDVEWVADHPDWLESHPG